MNLAGRRQAPTAKGPSSARPERARANGSCTQSLVRRDAESIRVASLARASAFPHDRLAVRWNSATRFRLMTPPFGVTAVPLGARSRLEPGSRDGLL